MDGIGGFAAPSLTGNPFTMLPFFVLFKVLLGLRLII